MQFLIFILVYPIIWLLSILPFKVLYLISDFFYLLVYYIIGYRKKTVIYNLKLAFPQKSESEITIISKKFYQHLVDLFIEMIKSFTISEKEMRKRFKPTNIEVLQKLEMNKKSALLLGAHRSNWEWFFSINLYINSDGYCVYKKLKNKHFDKKILETRGKYGTTLVSTKEIFDTISYNYKNKILSFYGILGDQSPKLKTTNYWSVFLGVKVPVHVGPEILAKENDLAIITYNTKKIKRGYYETTLKLLTESPNDFKDYELTELYLRDTEKVIHENPEYYFWTHKRFKHRDKAPD